METLAKRYGKEAIQGLAVALLVHFQRPTIPSVVSEATDLLSAYPLPSPEPAPASADLDQAASDYVHANSNVTGSFNAVRFDAFRAGAAWQADRQKEERSRAPCFGLTAEEYNRIFDHGYTRRQNEENERRGQDTPALQSAADQCEDVETGRYRSLMAMLDQINRTTVNNERGLVDLFDKVNKLGVEKWREAIKEVEKEQPVKMTPLEEVDDETLEALFRSEQLPPLRYMQERDRRKLQGVKVERHKGNPDAPPVPGVGDPLDALKMEDLDKDPDRLSDEDLAVLREDLKRANSFMRFWRSMYRAKVRAVKDNDEILDDLLDRI